MRARATPVTQMLACIARPLPLAACFLLLALPLGVFLALRVPVGQEPDEPFHLMRAEGLLHGGWIGHREMVTRPDGRRAEASGMETDPALVWVLTSPVRPFDPHPIHLTPEMLAQARAVRWSDRPMFIELGGLAGYGPAFYLPEAATLATARWLGVIPLCAFFAARLVNLGCFLAMGTAALLLATRARALLFCTLSMPMTLALAASASQDGLLIGATTLAMALLTRGDAAASRRPAFGIAAGLLACVALAKPPYLPLVAMLLLPLPRPPARHGWEIGRRLAVLALISVAILAWSSVVLRHVATPRLLPPYEAGPLWPGPRPAVFHGTDPAAQLRVLLADPSRLLTLPAVVMWRDVMLWRGVIGVLGWINLLLPGWMYALWCAALAAAAIAGTLGAPRGDGADSTWPDMALTAFAAIAAVSGVFFAEYLTWTPVGLDWIGGMQGRYLLPLIPPLALALPRLRTVRAAWPGHALTLLPLTAAAADVLALPRLVLDYYYGG